MNVLFIGDIFASAGRGIVADCLPKLVSEYAIDLTIANVENAAGGFGVTPQIADELFRLGIDVMTTGNHVWDKREIYPYLDSHQRILRPANYGRQCPGRGVVILTAANGVRCAVINLQGRTYMPPTNCPFEAATQILDQMDPAVKVRFVDFHAEVTSEKVAMGWHLDGRVSACIGTHTHIPTADARILPKGTAYQTDAGMTGPYDSVIGVEKEAILQKFHTALPVRMEAARGWVELRGVVVRMDALSGKADSIEPVTAKHER